MVGNVFRQEPFQAPLVESNHLVGQLAAAASCPTLGDAILPGTCERGAQGLEVQQSNGGRDLCPVFCIPSWIRYRGAVAKGKASRNCWMIPRPVGCLVMLKCRIR